MPFRDEIESHREDADGQRPMSVTFRPSRTWELSGRTSDAQRCIDCPANVQNGGLKGIDCTGINPATGEGNVTLSLRHRDSNAIARQTNCGLRPDDLEETVRGKRVSTQGKQPTRIIRTPRKVWYPNPR